MVVSHALRAQQANIQEKSNKEVALNALIIVLILIQHPLVLVAMTAYAMLGIPSTVCCAKRARPARTRTRPAATRARPAPQSPRPCPRATPSRRASAMPGTRAPTAGCAQRARQENSRPKTGRGCARPARGIFRRGRPASLPRPVGVSTVTTRTRGPRRARSAQIA